ncbi:Scd6-like Sm domain-containing protein [Aspergillus cavernicola]|uniref:Scd6-like Sm domain-containing protein n=1 Tax=Aspergillus cavernicola TaxID=176166 RepID=A0ABR4IL02_9EURO
MDMNHLIGQRFNLISKSDIRYVGTLHEINPEASTIALQNVVSFGTEGRRGSPAEEIPPSNSIYEYIVFRGSDVKDISVAEDKKENAQPEPPQMPDDPAILGSVPQPGPGPQGLPPQPQQPPQPPQQPPQQPHQQPPPGPRPPPPPGYPQQPQFPGYYSPYGPRYPPFPPGPGYPAMPYGAPPGWYPPGQGFPQPPGPFPPQMSIGPPGQHPTPPTQRAAPTGPRATSELPVGDRPVGKPPGQETAPDAAPTASAPTPPVESKPSVAEAVKATVAPTERAPPTGPRGGRAPPVIPITTPAKSSVPAPLAPATANNMTQGTAQAAITEATRAATAAVAAAMAKLPQPAGQKKPQHADPSVEGVTKQIGEMKPYEGNRAPRGGQQSRGRGGHRGQYPTQAKKVEVPTVDYDFEMANAKFNKQDLVKEAIASGSPLEEVETPVEPDSSADLTATTQSANVYNKGSSFFDNISSESRDREEHIGARAGGREWRGEEEKRNIETFGQGSVDGYRSSYRGRGRGRGYGRGRGGYGRGYGSRGRGGRNNMSQSTGVPTPN